MSEKVFDAVVVGSGAAGGWAAKELCERGLSVLLLDAGRRLAARDFRGVAAPFARVRPPRPSKGSPIDWRLRKAVQRQCYKCTRYTRELFVDDTDVPYSHSSGAPFLWFQSRVEAGRTLLWDGRCYRMSDQELKAASRDGIGADWPIAYAELSPYYDRVEAFIGIRGTREGIPHLPDSLYAGPAPQGEVDLLLRQRWEKRGFRPVPVRAALAAPGSRTQPPCHLCGTTGRGCLSAVHSASSTLRAAARTGRLNYRAHSVVRHVTVDRRGRARGVHAIDTLTGKDFEARASLVFLCASPLESTRILLNSGLGDSSGALGHYLMDHFGNAVAGADVKRPGPAGRPSAPSVGLYVPRWQNLGRARDKDFVRGYGLIVGTTAPCRFMQERAEQGGTDRVVIGACGEMLPRYENFVEINKNVTDRWGIPTLTIHCRPGENELAMSKDMYWTVQQFAEDAGLANVSMHSPDWTPGMFVHESGTCRMGKDRRRSVLNPYNEAHDVPGLFVTDASCFPSQGVQNPTLTVMALTVRACEYAVRKRNRLEH